MTAKRIELIPFDPDNETHVAQLIYQRILAGWGKDDVPGWRVASKKGDKHIFWIVPTCEAKASFTLPLMEELSLKKGQIGPESPTPTFTALGHIAIDWIDQKKDETQANREKNRACVATFFILKSQQGNRLGSESMDLIEAMAATPQFGVRELTLNTLCQESATSPAHHENLGITYSPTARVNQHWYERRGYVAYKVAPRYEEYNVKGEKILLDAVYMRKYL